MLTDCLWLQAEFLLSSATATVTTQADDDARTQMSTAQWWCPQPIRRSERLPQIKPAEVTKELASSDAWCSGTGDYIAPPVVITAIWQAEGTDTIHVLPRSHLSGRNPGVGDGAADGAVAVELAPGDVLLVDGRLWRGSESAGKGVRAVYEYTGPQFRTRENSVLSTTTEALEAMPVECKEQLGFKVWFSYGGSFGRLEEAGPRELLMPPQLR